MSDSKNEAEEPEKVDTENAGQSGGGPYPNPHTHKKARSNGFLGHGGQTEMDYHGSGQLGDRKTSENSNAPTGGTRGKS